MMQEIDLKKMPEFAEIESLSFEMILSALEEELEQEEQICRLGSDGQGNPALYVQVQSPMEREAMFTISSAENDMPAYRIEAVYLSDALEDGKLDSLVVPLDQEAGEVCSDFLIPFLDDCFRQDMEVLADTLIINNENLNDYVLFLDDDALTLDGIYAIGIRVLEEAGPLPVGALSFRLNEESLIIENVYVKDDYQGYGLERFAIMDLENRIARAMDNLLQEDSE